MLRHPNGNQLLLSLLQKHDGGSGYLQGVYNILQNDFPHFLEGGDGAQVPGDALEGQVQPVFPGE
ncbi:hypothetical protein D3C72_2477760 [compost metagenome]